MPQMDFVTFFVQVFCFLAFCVSMYIFALKYIAPFSARVIKMREKFREYVARNKNSVTGAKLYELVIKYFKFKN